MSNENCLQSLYGDAPDLFVSSQKAQRELGLAVRWARSKRGLTQSQFAKELGMHRTQLGHVEQGRKDCQLSTLLRISHVLGLPLSMLLRSAAL